VIVRQLADSLLIIRQSDHAALAGRIMQQWSSLATFARRESILRATAEHDLGWDMHDAAVTVDAAGQIEDFRLVPLAIKQGVWLRTIAELASDPWAAALVAHHAIFVYDRFRPDPEWQEFFVRLEQLRAELLQANTRLTQTDLERDYVFVRLGDLASLTFCCGWTDAQYFAEYTITLNDTSLVITPDPFDGRELAIDVSARKVPLRRFVNDGDARAALQSARLITWSGSAIGNSSA
jgi:hypothetical protein